MQRYGSLLGLLLLLAVGVPVVAVSRPSSGTADDLEHNRQLLEKWRKDPEHYQRLRENLDTFWSLLPAEQQRLRQIDQAVHATPSRERVDRLFRDLDRNKDGKISKDEARGEVRRHFDEIDRDKNGSIDRDELLNAAPEILQKQLLHVLVRYNAWLNRLRETDPDTHARIQAAPRGERLALIREVRRHQWIESLPDRVREQLLKLPPEQQEKEMARLRKEEVEHRREWMRPDWLPPHRHPRKLSDYPLSVQQEVHQFVSALLIPHLSEGERNTLKRAQGKPGEIATILNLAQNHSAILPPLPGREPIATFEQLPPAMKKMLTSLPEWKRGARPGPRPGFGKERNKLSDFRNKWPDYALAVVRVLERHQIKESAIPPLGASRPTEFPLLARDFIEHQLPKVLSDKEKKELEEAEGKWPKYPHLVRDLARKHLDRLAKPMPPLALPGPIELWQPPGPGERGPGKRPHPPRDVTPAH